MQLLDELLKETINSSMFETRRNYVSLSNIIKPVDELLNDYHNGYSANEDALLKCRLGYWMEQGMKERLLKIFGVVDSYCVSVPGTNNIKGHPDFGVLNNGFTAPGDCKSFAMDEHLPVDRVSNKIFWQMQAYMLYSNAPISFVVCESRQSGKLSVITIRENRTIQSQIKNKVQQILQRLDA